MKTHSLFLKLIAFLLAISGMMGCQVQSLPPTSVLTPVVLQPTATVLQQPTAAPVLPTLQPSEPTATSLSRSTEPMRFTFPTPAPIPASRWRPPLYDPPWALGPNDHFYFTRPIAADDVNWPEWDYRYGGVAESKELAHSGIDIAANRGTPVIAAGPGVVGWAGYGLLKRDDDVNDPYGLAVMIEHDFGYNGHRLSTVYGHLARIDVTVGQRVQPGQQLGIVGTTGISTGPHLHFEVRLQFGDYAATRNPELWLSPPQGWGVLVARLMREDTTPLYQKAVYVRSKADNRTWEVHTYGPNNTHYDDYYRENLVLSDLPAGDYEVSFEYKEAIKKFSLSIRPGGITYFVYREGRGFSTALPGSTADSEWLITPRPASSK